MDLLVNETNSYQAIDQPKEALRVFLGQVDNHIIDAKNIVAFIRTIDPQMTEQMDRTLEDMKTNVDKLLLALDDTNQEWPKCKFFGPTFVSSGVGLMLGAITAPVDCGLLAVIFGLAGGVLGRVWSNSGDNIGKLIKVVIANMQELQMLMSLVYTKNVKKAD